MATCDHPSDLIQRIAYPVVQRPGLRIHSRIAALLTKDEKHAPIPSSPQRKEVDALFREIEAGAKSGRNPLAGLAPWPSVSPPAGGNYHSAVSHGATAQETNADDVVLTATAAAAGNAMKLQAPNLRLHTFIQPALAFRASA